MKKTGLISVVHNPGDPPIKTNTDWAAVAALTDEQIEAAVRDDPDAAPIGFFNHPGFIPFHVKRPASGWHDAGGICGEVSYSGGERCATGSRAQASGRSGASLSHRHRSQPEAVAGLLGEAA